ncbi:hypothetical protein ACFVYE_38585 [Streptomyces sp. NPDC058239]|uniref:hypothetical protein n=1 Tax=Streptomyces sp. NPDC058239 TaxID=3346395 RepID=UPI0036ED1A06
MNLDMAARLNLAAVTLPGPLTPPDDQQTVPQDRAEDGLGANGTANIGEIDLER